MKKLKYIRFFVKNSWFYFRYRIFHKKKSVERFMGQKNITLDYSNEILKQMILSDQPFSAIRFGAVELSCVNNYEKIQLGWKKSYKKPVVYSIKNGAGVFPTTIESLNQYAQTAIQAFLDAQILGISGIHMEDYFYQNDNLSFVVFLVDSRREIREEEVDLFDFFAEENIPYITVFTKADKLNQSEKSRALKEVKKHSHRFDNNDVIFTSINDKTSIDNLRKLISAKF